MILQAGWLAGEMRHYDGAACRPDSGKGQRGPFQPGMVQRVLDKHEGVGVGFGSLSGG